jgi:hypothetical protein
MNPFIKLRRLVWKAAMLGLPRGPHVTRYTMYERLRALGAKLPKQPGRVLSISASENIAELLGLQSTEIVAANYPEHNVLQLGFDDNVFDYVVSDQVLEHIV